MRRVLWACLVAACSLHGAESPLAVDLRRVAEVASVMLDGDACSRIETARSKHFSTLKDTRDPWRYGDNYEVDVPAFNQTKKTLMRMARLCQHACDVNLWMPTDAEWTRVQVVIRNVHEMSQFWTWGEMNQPMPVEMKRVFTNRAPVTAQRAGIVSVLAPVFNSLNDVVGVAEVVSEVKGNPRENVK